MGKESPEVSSVIRIFNACPTHWLEQEQLQLVMVTMMMMMMMLMMMVKSNHDLRALGPNTRKRTWPQHAQLRPGVLIVNGVAPRSIAFGDITTWMAAVQREFHGHSDTVYSCALIKQHVWEDDKSFHQLVLQPAVP